MGQSFFCSPTLLPLLDMLGPFYHSKHHNISLDLAVTITREACWQFSDCFWSFPAWIQWTAVGEIPQYHCFMDP
jgi:hypothetical protein